MSELEASKKGKRIVLTLSWKMLAIVLGVVLSGLTCLPSRLDRCATYPRSVSFKR